MPKVNLPKKSYKKGDLPETKEEWVAYINKSHDSGLEKRRRQEIQWAANMAFFKGYQSIVLDSREGALFINDGELQEVYVNRIASFIESRHAKITKNRPQTKVIPNTSDRLDINAAKSANDTLAYLWRKIMMEEQYDDLFIRMLICGTAFMESVWDPNGGDEIEDIKKGADEFLNVTEEMEFEAEKLFLGEVRSNPLSAFQIIPADDSIRRVWDQPYMIKRTHLPVSVLEEIYPDFKGEIKGENPKENKTKYENLIDRMAAASISTEGKDKEKDSVNSTALVKEMWIKPNIQYEKGIVATVIGKELVQISTFPNDYGRNIYPFVKFVDSHDGFNFWGLSKIERLIPIQRAINTLKQKKVRNAVLMANGKWLLPKGSQVSEEALTDEEGEVIEYNNQVGKPEQAAIAPLPRYVEALGDELIQDMRDVGGQRETSFAPSPNLTASVAMQTQAELTDEILGPMLKRIARGYELVGNQQLLLIDQEYSEERKVVILGENGEMKVAFFNNADLRHHTDVHIEIESMFPDFRGAKQQRLLEMWDRRIITDPSKLLNAMRFGDMNAIYEEEETVQDQVWLDIQRIKKGKEPQVHQFQNHMLYVRELSKFVNTPEFLKLIPERKQLALQSLQVHLQMLAGALPNQGEPVMEQNQAAVGSPQGPVVP